MQRKIEYPIIGSIFYIPAPYPDLLAFPGSIILIPFRDPLQQAISLLNQHERFSLIQAESRFSRAYMHWLGHYEFGLNHRPFLFGNRDAYDEFGRLRRNNINYWLYNWKNYYSYVLENLPVNALLICHETFCSNPGQLLDELYKKLDIKSLPVLNGDFQPVSKTVPGVDGELIAACDRIYERLSLKALDPIS